MHSRSAPRTVDRVGPGTHVRLVDDEGHTREHIVLQETEDQPLLEHELTGSDAEAAGIMGLQRGEALVENAGSWMEKEWRVSEIETSIRYAYNDVLSNYPMRFPAEGFFVKGFKMSSGSLTLTDLAPFISALTSGIDRFNSLRTCTKSESCLWRWSQESGHFRR